MHLAHLRLRDFRNYARLDSDFVPGFHVLMGDNAQGKTNILEAIYLMATLRSFRGAGGALMVRQGQKGYFVGGQAISTGQADIRIYWSATERKLTLNSQPVRRLADYLGTVRAVVFCSEDLLLVKGTGRIRRRFIDLLLSQSNPHYITLLHRYTQALKSRNALLKQKLLDETALESFSRELADAGDQIRALRETLVPDFSPLAAANYSRIAGPSEPLQLAYAPSVKTDMTTELARFRTRERAFRSTLVGPHRDDLQILIHGRPAAQFASEGQKRSIAIAMKMAQAEFLTKLHGAPPILLIDDVMGELDLKRRTGLMPLLERSQQSRGQVFMTCTEESWPAEIGRELHRWKVQSGQLQGRS
ncbi:MAG: DNA replication/repair protein RecF [Verrucomicrobia bacterium]|nr:DNA replication/repair protein RecF [Verrucomicrobiota bacterium]